MSWLHRRIVTLPELPAKAKAKRILRELEAQHLAAYLLAVEHGVERERDRVNAHLIMAQHLGTEGAALAARAIRAGESLTPELVQQYRELFTVQALRERKRMREHDASNQFAQNFAPGACRQTERSEDELN